MQVPDGAAAAAKAFYVADTTGESSAALQAFVKNDYLTKTRWIMSSKIETLQKSSLKAAAVAKEEAAAAKGGAAARDAAAGKLTVAQGLSTAAICSCSATPREYLASGPFAPDSLPREPMQPKVRERKAGIVMHRSSGVSHMAVQLQSGSSCIR